MAVTGEEVKRIASLARLRIENEEIESFTLQFNEILNYIDKLNQLDTKDVEPLSHPVEIKKKEREDLLVPSIEREQALKNAPSQNGIFFGVPKVIKNT